MALKEEIDPESHFIERFEAELADLDEDVEIRPQLVESMRFQGRQLAPEAVPALYETFGEWKLIEAEEKLYEGISECEDYMFKGYIDLVIRTEDGKYHIIDWKTCSWGWDARKRSDPMVTYQLTLYKKYFAIKHDIDPSEIETHFALLKRTAKRNQVEFIDVSSGTIKTNNATKLLMLALKNIENKKAIKNRLSCKGCQFYKTEHCI